MTEALDDLRIIAKDARGLPSEDRAALVRAADELEAAQRALIATNLALIESQARRIALNDVLIDIKRSALTPPPQQGVQFSGIFGWVAFPNLVIGQ